MARDPVATGSGASDRAFDADLAEMDLDRMQKFRDYIRLAGPKEISESPAKFQKILNGAIDRGIAMADLATAFGVNKSTISRWAAGNNLPQIYMRPHVITWLFERLGDRATALEREIVRARDESSRRRRRN